MNSLLSNLGSLFSQIQPDQAGLNAGRIAKEVSKTPGIEPLFDKAKYLDNGLVGRMDFKLSSKNQQVYLARVYATGDLAGVMGGLSLLTVRNSSGSELGTSWAEYVDTDRECIAILATGDGPMDLLKRMLGAEGGPLPGAEAALRQFYKSSEHIAADIPESLKEAHRQTLLCHLPNERTSARLWDSLGFTIKAYRGGYFFRIFDGG